MRSHHPAHFNLCPFRPRVWRVPKERVPGSRDPNEVTAKCNRNTKYVPDNLRKMLSRSAGSPRIGVDG